MVVSDTPQFVEQLLSSRTGELVELRLPVRNADGHTTLVIFWDGTPAPPAIAPAALALVNAGPGYGGDIVMPAPAPTFDVAEPAAFGLLLAALGALVLSRRRPA